MAEKIEKEIMKYAGMGGIALALLFPVVGFFGFNVGPYGWLVPALGLVAGLMLTPSTSLGIWGLILISGAGALAVVPMVGTLLNAVFASVATFTVGVFAPVALRQVLKKFGFKI